MAEQKLEEKIIDIIESLRIYINQDGGDLEFVKYKDGFVHIKILGACIGCDLVDVTYHEGIENILKDEIPEIKGLIIDN